jgi:hypothetical protein
MLSFIDEGEAGSQFVEFQISPQRVLLAKPNNSVSLPTTKTSEPGSSSIQPITILRLPGLSEGQRLCLAQGAQLGYLCGRPFRCSETSCVIFVIRVLELPLFCQNDIMTTYTDDT